MWPGLLNWIAKQCCNINRHRCDVPGDFVPIWIYPIEWLKKLKKNLSIRVCSNRARACTSWWFWLDWHLFPGFNTRSNKRAAQWCLYFQLFSRNCVICECFHVCFNVITEIKVETESTARERERGKNIEIERKKKKNTHKYKRLANKIRSVRTHYLHRQQLIIIYTNFAWHYSKYKCNSAIEAWY